MRSSALAVLLIAALTLAPGCGSDTERLARQRAQARALIAEGRDGEALRLMRQTLHLDPRNAALNLEIARTAERLERDEDALFYYREAHRLQPDLDEAALAQARLLATDDPEAADALVDEVLARDPESVVARIRRSEVQLARGEADAALATIEDAVDRDAESGAAWLQRGRVQRARLAADPAAFDAARDAYERAAETLEGRDAVRAWIERAQLLASRETPPAAVAAAADGWRRAVEEAARRAGGRFVREAALEARDFARRTGDRDLVRWSLEREVEADPAKLAAWSELARLEERVSGSGEAVFRRLLERRPEDGEALERYADFLLARGRSREAEALLRNGLARGIEAPVVLGALLDVHFTTGDRDAAQSVLDRLRREYPEHERTQLAEARRSLVEGETDVAAESLRALGASAPTARVFYTLAIAELQRGELLAARAAVDRAIETAGEFWPAPQRLLATIQHSSQDWVGLLRTLRRLPEAGVALRPSEQVMRAQALYALGRQSEGRQVLRTLAEAEPPFVPALVVLSQREHRVSPERVRALLLRGLEQRPGAIALVTELARLEASQGRTRKAVELLDGAAGDAPPVELRVMRARALATLGEWERAEADLTSAFESAPRHRDTLSLLVALYQQRGQPENAIPVLERVLEADALPPPGLEVLGRLYLRSGREDDAIRVLERAVGMADLPGAQNDLAYLLAKHGRDLDRALRLAQGASRQLGDLPQVADTLGYVYLQKGLTEPAIAQFRQAIALAREAGGQEMHPSYHYHLGLALRRRGEEAGAAAALEAALAIGEDFDGVDDARAQLDAARAAAEPGAGEG